MFIIFAIVPHLALPTSPGLQEQESSMGRSFGCFSYGYKYTTTLTNLTVNPVIKDTPELCQATCEYQQGCAKFTYLIYPKECWLSGSDATLAVADVLGAISGPRKCTGSPTACFDIPGPHFPGKNVNESMSSWKEGNQPTNLECWPRDARGFPAACEKVKVRVVEDTRKGWPGKCSGMTEVPSEKLNGETCQATCMKSPLCAVWMLVNGTASSNTHASNNTHGSVCKMGHQGNDCYNKEGTPPIIAQRLVHGSFRMLMNSAGRRIENLVKAFDATQFPNWETAKVHCRNVCYSYILCQFWQYSKIDGCWVEDPTQKQVAYPLVRDGVGMETDDGVGMETSMKARQVKAGEYIQHTCNPEHSKADGEIPEVFPPNTLYGGGTGTSIIHDKSPPSTTKVHHSTPVTPPPTPTTNPAYGSGSHNNNKSSGFSILWMILIGILVVLCIAIVITAVKCALRDRDSDDEEDYYDRRRMHQHQVRSFDMNNSNGLPLYGYAPGMSFMQPQPQPYMQMPPTMPVFPPGSGPCGSYPNQMSQMSQMPGY